MPVRPVCRSDLRHQALVGVVPGTVPGHFSRNARPAARVNAGAPESDFASPIRLAALGCGRVFERFHLPALRRSPNWTLTAAVDPSMERLRWIGGLAPGVALAGALPELDSAVEFDAVLVSSPPEIHCALASEALRRGAHVLIEKPMVLRTSEAPMRRPGAGCSTH